MRLGWDARKWLAKKAKLGFRGYPVATVAFYGPNDRRASKVAVGIVMAAETEPTDMRRWLVETDDVRNDEATLHSVAEFLRAREVRSVAMTNGILGCPHEEGIDYPEGETCPQCPFWADRDRFEDESTLLVR